MKFSEERPSILFHIKYLLFVESLRNFFFHHQMIIIKTCLYISMTKLYLLNNEIIMIYAIKKLSNKKNRK